MDTAEKLSEVVASFKEKQVLKSKLENEIRKLQYDKDNKGMFLDC